MEFTYSFDATPAPVAIAPLLAAVPGNALALSGEEFLWRSWDGAIGARLAMIELHALSLCPTFAPRDAHVARVAQSGVPHQQAAGVVDNLVARGLLRTVAGFVPADAGQGSDVGEPLVAIRTCARSASLAQLLSSILDDERRFGVARRYVVIDDSREREHVVANRAAVDAFASASRSRVTHFDRSARETRFAALVRDVDAAQRDAAAALLLAAGGGVPTGALPWNWAVLLGAGGALSLLDDDMLFPLRMPPGGGDTRLELRDEQRPSVRFFDEPAGPRLPVLEEEPYAYLRRFVGRSGAALLASLGTDHAQLAGRAPADAGLLALNGTVQCAITGTYGALAWDTGVYFNAGDDASLRDLLREPFRFARLNGDEIWYGATQPRLVTAGAFTPLLLDARTLAPFATTFGKADDTAFLGLFAAVRAQPLMVLVPASVGHAPPETRDRIARSREPLIHDLNSWLGSWAGEVAGLLHSDDPARRLIALGELARELAGSSDRELSESLLRWRHMALARLVERLREALARVPHGPREWREHVASLIAVNDREIERAPTAQEIARARGVLGELAAGAAAWPLLWQAAVERPFDG